MEWVAEKVWGNSISIEKKCTIQQVEPCTTHH